LLVAFKEHDAITACFDEEGQYMMEGTAEPTVCVVFSPRKPDEVRRTLRIVERFIALNCELFRIGRGNSGVGEKLCKYICRSGRTIASSCMRLC
jgi:hypothetical protein